MRLIDARPYLAKAQRLSALSSGSQPTLVRPLADCVHAAARGTETLETFLKGMRSTSNASGSLTGPWSGCVGSSSCAPSRGRTSKANKPRVFAVACPKSWQGHGSWPNHCASCGPNAPRVHSGRDASLAECANVGGTKSKGTTNLDCLLTRAKDWRLNPIGPTCQFSGWCQEWRLNSRCDDPPKGVSNGLRCFHLGASARGQAPGLSERTAVLERARGAWRTRSRAEESFIMQPFQCILVFQMPGA